MRRSIISALEHESRRSLCNGKPLDAVNEANAEEIKTENSILLQNATTGTSGGTVLIDYAKIVWQVAAQTERAPVAHELLVRFCCGLTLEHYSTRTLIFYRFYYILRFWPW